MKRPVVKDADITMATLKQIEYGSPPDVPEDTRLLFKAILAHDDRATAAAIAAGAELDMWFKYVVRPPKSTLKSQRRTHTGYALEAAFEADNLPAFEAILDAKPALATMPLRRAEEDEECATMMHTVCKADIKDGAANPRSAFVELLLRRGADPNKCGCDDPDACIPCEALPLELLIVNNADDVSTLRLLLRHTKPTDPHCTRKFAFKSAVCLLAYHGSDSDRRRDLEVAVDIISDDATHGVDLMDTQVRRIVDDYDDVDVKPVFEGIRRRRVERTIAELMSEVKLL